jgi:flagellar hook-basal body complex protein FliE
MDTKALDQLISQLHAASARARGATAGAIGASAAGQAGAFGDLLKSSIDQVNGSQQNAARLAKDFELGATNVSLQDVMIASSKANIAFQATVQVRNRLVSAYHDIMSMPL